MTISTPDGNWQVQTLEPVSWIEAHQLGAGSSIQLSDIVDLAEMGTPGGIYGTVISIAACPPIEAGPGRVVLTTVSHLNDFGVGSANPTPIIGGGASLKNLSASEIVRIQNAANRLQTEITVVGSRAEGTAGPLSDWDYIIDGNSGIRHSAASALPEGFRGGIGMPRNQDIFTGPLNPDLPYIKFTPKTTGAKP